MVTLGDVVLKHVDEYKSGRGDTDDGIRMLGLEDFVKEHDIDRYRASPLWGAVNIYLAAVALLAEKE